MIWEQAYYITQIRIQEDRDEGEHYLDCQYLFERATGAHGSTDKEAAAHNRVDKFPEMLYGPGALHCVQGVQLCAGG